MDRHSGWRRSARSQMTTDLELTRSQILTFRRRTAALDERLPRGRQALQRAAWAGLQDSMPRAALLSIHARMAGTEPGSWEDPSLAQVWGPRFSAYVVAKRDLAVFTLGRLPDELRQLKRAQDLAARLRSVLAGRRMTQGTAAREMAAKNANELRYAAPTGTILIRWDGSHQPDVWNVPAPEMDPHEARLELARRYLHVFAPATPEAFAIWAGIGPRSEYQYIRNTWQIVDAGSHAYRGSMDPEPRRTSVPRSAWSSSPGSILAEWRYLVLAARR